MLECASAIHSTSRSAKHAALTQDAFQESVSRIQIQRFVRMHYLCGFNWALSLAIGSLRSSGVI